MRSIRRTLRGLSVLLKTQRNHAVLLRTRFSFIELFLFSSSHFLISLLRFYFIIFVSLSIKWNCSHYWHGKFGLQWLVTAR